MSAGSISSSSAARPAAPSCPRTARQSADPLARRPESHALHRARQPARCRGAGPGDRPQLEAPQPVALFPEGTTGPGGRLLPFRPHFLQRLTPPPAGRRGAPGRDRLWRRGERDRLASRKAGSTMRFACSAGVAACSNRPPARTRLPAAKTASSFRQSRAMRLPPRWLQVPPGSTIAAPMMRIPPPSGSSPSAAR